MAKRNRQRLIEQILKQVYKVV